VIAFADFGHAQHALDDLHWRLHVRHRAVVPAPGLHLRISGHRNNYDEESKQ
jgi:hypothetical protein